MLWTTAINTSNTIRLATVGSRAFPVAAAHIWNSSWAHRLSFYVAVIKTSFENIPTAAILSSSTLVDLAVI